MFPVRDLYYVEKPIVYDELKKDGSNRHDFFCASGTLDKKSFVNNYGGWPRSDLAIINEQTDFNVAKAMLANIEQFPESQRSNFSEAELLIMNKSKYTQSISENLAYTEKVLQFRDEKLAELNRLKAAQLKEKEMISFVNNENKEE